MRSYSDIVSVAALLLLPFTAATPFPGAAPPAPATDAVQTPQAPAKDTPDAVIANASPFAHNIDVIFESLPLKTENGTLPEPEGLALRYITIGRGVQNYTCATSTPESIPKAIGALAVLYDVTARALLTPEIVQIMSDVAVTLPSSSFILGGRPLDIPNVGTYPVIGEHFFTADGTPFFDVYDAQKRIFCKLVTKINAPTNASKGPAGTGSVAWLDLAAKDGSVGFASVYRVSTAGGNPPTSCAGQPSVISIPYAAAYHFYGWM